LISVTDPEEVSLVTQMLPEPSAAIPTGEEKELEKVGQEEEEEQEVAVEVISRTSPEEEVSLVTQMLPEPSAAIPAGVNDGDGVVIIGQSVVVAQEVVPLGISITPSVTTTQTLFEGSTAMSVPLVATTEVLDEDGGV
jgi:hypothetical protein